MHSSPLALLYKREYETDSKNFHLEAHHALRYNPVARIMNAMFFTSIPQQNSVAKGDPIEHLPERCSRIARIALNHRTRR